MSKSPNPFSQPDNWQEIFEQDEQYTKLRSSLFEKSFNQTPNLQLNNKPTFNLSNFMFFNFAHFTKYSMASIAVFTLLASGLSAQAFAPDILKPSNLLADSNSIPPINFKFADCNESIKVLTNTEKVNSDNYSSSKYGNTLFIKAAQGDDSVRIRCYPADGSINWSDVYDFNLKSQNKGIRYNINKFYCKNIIRNGEINKYHFGCVDEPIVSKISKQELPFLTENFKNQLDDNKIYYKDVGSLITDKTDDFDFDFYSTYFISTRDNHIISISTKKLDYFKNKIQVDLK